MGRAVDYRRFDAADYRRFGHQLNRETDQLRECFEQKTFAGGPITLGYEVETCLVDANGLPADANMGFLERLNMPTAVPELARCNVELNGLPRTIAGRGLADMQAELDEWMALARRTADSMGLYVLAIGILPTLRESDMTLKHLSPSPRYRLLNERVAELRGKDGVDIDIHGVEHYRGRFDSIMAESAATSFQLHLSLPPGQASRWYNAAQLVSGPLLAVSANSPFLFGQDLWAETRIPTFAQAVDTGNVHFVTFGDGYVDSLMDLFESNRAEFPILLPAEMTDRGRFDHLNLHNGSIWRWNRPIIGEADDLRLRVEHRGLPSGPSVLDMVANCALFNGLVAGFGSGDTPLESYAEFSDARANFYRAARYGLEAEMHWRGGRVGVSELYREQLLPAARDGLALLEVDDDLAAYYLEIIARRLSRGLSGAGWQREWVRLHGRDMAGLVQAYLDRQISGLPVAEWTLNRC